MIIEQCLAFHFLFFHLTGPSSPVSSWVTFLFKSCTSVYSLYGFSGSSRTHQGRIAKARDHRNLNLYRFEAKRKRFKRKQHINKNHNVYHQQNVHKYMLKKAKQLNRLDDFSGYSG
eukprot:534882_1